VASAQPQSAPAEDEALWNFVWLSDTEAHWQGCSNKMPPLLAKVAANRPKMVVHTGDSATSEGWRVQWETVPPG
jgi:hypothetical protein